MLFSIKSKKNAYCKLILPILWALYIGVMFTSCNHYSDTKITYSDYGKILDSANHKFDAGFPKKSIEHLDSVTNLYHDFTTVQRFYYFDYNYNYYYHIKNNPDTAMLYADSMLNLFDTYDKKINYPALYGQAHFFKGDLLFDANKYPEAYQYYYQGKTIATNSLNNCTMADYSYRMGMIMYKQEHYRLGASYFKSSFTQNSTCEWNFRMFYRMQELLSNTGLCYSKINETDSAIMYYNKALRYIDSAGTQFDVKKELLDVARAVVYGNEANIYTKTKNYTIAERLLKKSIAVNLRKNDDNNDALLSELKLGHLYDLENRSDLLFSLLQAIQKQLDTIKNQDGKSDWYLLMAAYYTKKSQPQTALDYLVKHDALQDIITNRDKKLKEADITEQMEHLRKSHEFDNLKRNNQLQQTYLKIAIVFGVMLLLIIFLIFLNWQKSKKNIKTLGNLNNQINDQNLNLASALNELSLSSQEKDRILRTVAHDLRNPLGGVASLTSLMAEESEYSDEQKELITLIKETSNNSIELINEILEATDDISGGATRELELVEINSLLSNSVELLRFKAAEKNQQIILDLIDNPIHLLISREKIWRVVSNLISNAIKFSPDKGIINVALTDEDDKVKISVADHGIGIPDNLKDKVFNMFTDAKRPGTAGEKSFGLGLSICQQIIENHHGKIWFESEVNKGTTFYIALNKPQN